MSTITEVSHTPGPWAVAGTIRQRGCCLQIEAEMHSPVAYIQGSDGGESLANARLIAAAPEMLEALRDLHRYLTDDEWRREMDERATIASDGNVNAYEMVTERARAAIAKAEGR